MFNLLLFCYLFLKEGEDSDKDEGELDDVSCLGFY